MSLVSRLAGNKFGTGAVLTAPREGLGESGWPDTFLVLFDPRRFCSRLFAAWLRIVKRPSEPLNALEVPGSWTKRNFWFLMLVVNLIGMS